MAVELDETDIRLINRLQDDGRVTNATLAESVGLSPSGCIRRVQQLEASGIISGYHALLSPEHVGLGFQVYLRVTLAGHDRQVLDTFIKKVHEWPQVITCHALTGECDFLLQIMTPDMGAYYDFLREDLTASSLISSINSNVVLNVVKQTHCLPLDHLKPETNERTLDGATKTAN